MHASRNNANPYKQSEYHIIRVVYLIYEQAAVAEAAPKPSATFSCRALVLGMVCLSLKTLAQVANTSGRKSLALSTLL